MSGKAIAALVGVVAVVGLLAYGVLTKSSDPLSVGDPAPTGELEVLGSTGETGSIADHAGHWVLANVWASWCVPCRDEAPALEDFWQANRNDGFVVVGIDSQDATVDALEFVDEFGLTYPQLRDGSGDFSKDDLKTTGVPESFLIDPEGNVAYAQHGPVTAEILEQQILPLISGGEGA